MISTADTLTQTHKLSCTLVKPLPKVSLIIFNLKLDSEHRILFECAIHLKKDTHTHTQWTLKHTYGTDSIARKFLWSILTHVQSSYLCTLCSVSYHFLFQINDWMEGRLHVIATMKVLLVFCFIGFKTENHAWMYESHDNIPDP